MKKFLLFVVMVCSLNLAVGQTQTSATYSAGDIPTSFGAYDATCNGPVTPLVVNIPPGDFVTSVDVVYDMIAQGGAYMSEQQSQIFCQDTGLDEGGNDTGQGLGGTWSYNRTGLAIANGVDADGVLTFEMRAYRTWGGTACDVQYQVIPSGTWTITVNHEPPPSCLPTSGTSSANPTGSSVDLAWAENGTATAWDIEVVEVGMAATGTPTYNDVTTNPYTIGALAFNTDYEIYVRADCGMDDTDVSEWDGPFFFANSYCDPAPASVDGQGITNVTMGTINNTTGTEPNNYGDYSAMSTDAPQGLPLAIDLTLDTGFGYTYNLWAWVDWNDDLDFNDPGEEFYLGETDGASITTFNASITVPLTASLGNHRIRLGGADSGLGSTSPSNPCYTGSFSSFEDYTLNVTAPPPCLPVADIALSNATGTTIDIAWTEVGTATAWDIEVVDAGNTPTGVPTYNDVSMPSHTITGLVFGNTYSFYVRADCGMDDTNTSIWVNVTFVNNYCTPAPISVDGQGITNVTMGIINNTTGAEPGNYGDYSAMSTDVPQGLPLAIDLTLDTGFGYTYNLWAWVDWNNDLDFDDPGEGFYLGETDGASITTFNASITVPLTASLGNHRIRLGGADFGLNVPPFGPCYTGSFSSFEDYTLNVIVPPSCQPVADLVVSNITPSSADISWTAIGAETTWDIEVVEAGNIPTGIPTYNDVTMNPFTITGLTDVTTYNVYVRADCAMDDTDVSIWIATGSFTTPCVPISTYPACEDFGTAGIPNCWALAGGEDWEFSTGAAYGAAAAGDHTIGGGTNYAWMDGSITNPDGSLYELYTPEYDVSSLTNPYLSYWVFTNNTNNPGDNNTLTVELWDGANWVLVETIQGDNPDWIEYSVDVNAVATITGNIIQFRFAFEATAASDEYYNDILVDDVCLKELPTCFNPSSLEVTNVTATDADIDFVYQGPGTEFIVEYGPIGFIPGTGAGTQIVVNTPPPFTITGLPPNTDLQIFVQEVCAVGEVSDFIGPETIKTNCLPINTFPACEDFTLNGLPECWSLVGPADWEFSTGAAYGAAAAGDHTAGGGTNYAWMDGSDADPGNFYELYTPTYDVSSLNDPFLSYWVFTNNTDDPGDNNTLYVELWDGANWILVETIQGDNPDWVEYTVNVNQLTTVTGDIQFRFIFESTAATNDYENDILIDDVCLKELPLNDIGVTSITAPTSGCGLGVEDVTIEVTNLGFNTQGGFFTGYSVNGVVQNTIPDGFISANVVPGASETYTFTTQYDFSAIGTYTIAAWTELAGDSDLANDTTVIIINNVPQINTLPFFEDFETTDGGFVAENVANGATTVWEWGAPTGGTIDAAGSGVNAWVTNLDGFYDNNSETYLVAPCMDFSNLDVDPELSFALRIDSEFNWDGAWVEVSLDAGTTWTVLGSDTDTDWYNNTDQQFQGDNTAWTTVTHAITGAAGEANVRLRFGFDSDGSASNFDGAGIDDISIIDVCAGGFGLTATSTDEAVEGTSADGTATVVASEPGAYTYLWSSGGTADVETGLSAGTHTVTVTNDLGCKEEIQVTVDYVCVAHFIDNITYTEESQNGVTNDGTVTVEANTTGPYTFNWSTGTETTDASGTSTETGLTAGVYYVTITDGNGCMDTDSIVVTAICPVNLGATIAVQAESIEGLADGTVSVVTNAGTAPFNYSWSSGGTADVETGLSAGTYTVTITDANGCVEVISATLDFNCPTTIGAAITGYPETIQDENDGAATATASGGLPPYQFDWSTGETGNTITGLSPGSYSVTVTDANGCMEVASVTIDESFLNTPVEDIESLSNLSISPNPTSGETIISVRFTESVDMNIDVLSVVGQKVSSFAYTQTTSEDVLIDLSEVPSGIYFVRLSVDGSVHTSRIVKK